MRKRLLVGLAVIMLLGTPTSGLSQSASLPTPFPGRCLEPSSSFVCLRVYNGLSNTGVLLLVGQQQRGYVRIGETIFTDLTPGEYVLGARFDDGSSISRRIVVEAGKALTWCLVPRSQTVPPPLREACGFE